MNDIQQCYKENVTRIEMGIDFRGTAVIGQFCHQTVFSGERAIGRLLVLSIHHENCRKSDSLFSVLDLVSSLQVSHS